MSVAPTATAGRSAPVALFARLRGLVKDVWRGRAGYIFTAPLLLFFLVFVLYPSLRTFWLVFMRFDFLRPGASTFVGLGNIIEWLRDARVLETFAVALKFTLLYVPISTVLALIVALLLDRVAQTPLGSFFRTMYYFPVVLPAGIIFIAWQWVYDPTWGPMNHLLVDILGLNWPYTKWLGDPDWALQSLVIMTVWRLMGATMILFLVGLNNIPRELFEAARIDGASEWGVIRHVTLPLLMPMFLVIMVLRLQVLGLAAEPLVMTGGGPVRSTMTYGLQAYFIAFRDGNMRMGYGATWFVMLGIVSTVLAYAGWRWFRSRLVD